VGNLRRIRDLIKANVTSIVDSVEDPKKMLNQLMLELGEEKRKAENQVRLCIADEKRLELQVRDHQEKLQQWQKRAEVAVYRDEDDLAREAIGRRNEYAAMVDELTRQWQEQHEMAEQLKDALEQLGRRYQEAQMKKQYLLNNYAAAKANQKASETIAKLSNTDHLAEFERVENKINEMTALSAASREIGVSSSLEEQFRELESGGVVEHDLIKLKEQLGKPLPQLFPGGSGLAALPSSNGAAGAEQGAGSTGAPSKAVREDLASSESSPNGYPASEADDSTARFA